MRCRGRREIAQVKGTGPIIVEAGQRVRQVSILVGLVVIWRVERAGLCPVQAMQRRGTRAGNQERGLVRASGRRRDCSRGRRLLLPRLGYVSSVVLESAGQVGQVGCGPGERGGVGMRRREQVRGRITLARRRFERTRGGGGGGTGADARLERPDLVELLFGRQPGECLAVFLADLGNAKTRDQPSVTLSP